MKWKTSISTKKDGQVYIRGKSLSKMVEEFSFADAIFFILSGKMPSASESKLFNAILISSIEHGVETPSAYVARTVASTGNSVNAALAAGVLTLGEHHGGAGEGAAKLLGSGKSAKEIVASAIKNKERLPGYGHKIYKDADPRAAALLKMADKLKLSGKYVKLAQDIQKELKTQSGKELPLNIDGAQAALLLEIGFDWGLIKSVFILSRLPGLIAHSHEEMTKEKPYRRFEEEDVEYEGPKLEK